MTVMWIYGRLITIVLVTLFLAISNAEVTKASDENLLVFAAASTTEAVKALTETFEARTGINVTASFAASSTLARQIEEGAPANIFISANQRWLAFLAKKGLLQQNSPQNIVTNSLAVVAPKDGHPVSSFNLEDLPAFLGGEYLAIGNPDHVPLGIYTKTALVSQGLWEKIQDKYVQLPNARAVRALVERGEVPAAIVYVTDARKSDRLKVIAAIPASAQPEIIYGMAIVKSYDSDAARKFFDFVRSPEAQEIFIQFGFAPYVN